MITGPQQAHLTQQLYTHVAPDEHATIGGALGGTLNCMKNCHGIRFLVDNGSGYVNRRGFDHAIAIGPGLAMYRESPTAITRPVTPPLTLSTNIRSPIASSSSSSKHIDNIDDDNDNDGDDNG